MKQKNNLIIDAIMFIVLMAIAGIGFLIKYVLIPGYKRTGIYEGNEELYFGGLTRHQWGNIHLLLSFLLLFLLVPYFGIERDPAYIYGPGSPRSVYFGIKIGNML